MGQNRMRWETCSGCATSWSHQCGNKSRFRYITALCPRCIAAFPLMRLAPQSTTTVHRRIR